MSEPTWRLVWLQTFTGGREVLETGLTPHQALMAYQKANTSKFAGPGGVFMIEQEDADLSELAPCLANVEAKGGQ